MNTQLFTCFGATHGGGNPALVVEDGPLDPDQRARLARERALTCVFIDAASEPGMAATLDFVYPHMRSPLCLHATLAATQVLFARQSKDAPLSVTTAMRGQRLALSREGDTVYVGLARQEAPQVAADEALARRLLAAHA